MIEAFLVKLPSHESHRTLLLYLYLITQIYSHIWWNFIQQASDQSLLVQVMARFVRQQTITWANVDPYQQHHIVSLDHKEITSEVWKIFTDLVNHIKECLVNQTITCTNFDLSSVWSSNIHPHRYLNHQLTKIILKIISQNLIQISQGPRS